MVLHSLILAFEVTEETWLGSDTCLCDVSGGKQRMG